MEAEAYDGPALIIAYSHCIAHGYDMAKGLEHQKAAVMSGYWPLFRYNPRPSEGRNPMTLDSKAPACRSINIYYAEMRYKMLSQANPKPPESARARANDVQRAGAV